MGAFKDENSGEISQSFWGRPGYELDALDAVLHEHTASLFLANQDSADL